MLLEYQKRKSLNIKDKTMRFIPFLVVGFVLMSGAGCDATVDGGGAAPDVSASSAVDATSVRAVQELSGAAQRLAYLTLTPGERRHLWTSKLRAQMDRPEYTSDQAGLIQRLHDFFDGVAFQSETSERDRDAFRDAWLADAEGTLPDDRIAFLAYRLEGDYADYLATLPHADTPDASATPDATSPDPKAITDCRCSLGSRYTCGRFTSWDTLEYGTCTTLNFCERTSSGCGFGFLYQCDASTCLFDPYPGLIE